MATTVKHGQGTETKPVVCVCYTPEDMQDLSIITEQTEQIRIARDLHWQAGRLAVVRGLGFSAVVPLLIKINNFMNKMTVGEM